MEKEVKVCHSCENRNQVSLFFLDSCLRRNDDLKVLK
jgi:hypothetical protein